MLSVSSHHDATQRPRELAPARPADAFRNDLLIWAEPVIADCITSAYQELDLGSAYCSLLTTHHRRLWRALILEHRQHVVALRADLLRDVHRAGLDAELVDDVDHDVLEELMDIVLKRFRSSRETAKGFGLVLLAAATNLGVGRPAPA